MRVFTVACLIAFIGGVMLFKESMLRTQVGLQSKTQSSEPTGIGKVYKGALAHDEVDQNGKDVGNEEPASLKNSTSGEAAYVKFEVGRSKKDELRPRRTVAWSTMASKAVHIKQTLGMFSSLRKTGTRGDLVLFLFGSEAQQLHGQYASWFQSLEVKVAFVPVPITASKRQEYNKILDRLHKWWDFVKLYAFLLKDYEKVIFLDSDLFFLANADELFDMPDGSHSDGPISPFNSGLLILNPSAHVFQELLGIILEGNFTYENGWRHSFRANFHASETTQGLFYYYYHFYIKRFKLLNRQVYNYQGIEPAPKGIKIVHFTSCMKPFESTTRCPKLKDKYLSTMRTSQETANVSISNEAMQEQIMEIQIPKSEF